MWFSSLRGIFGKYLSMKVGIQDRQKLISEKGAMVYIIWDHANANVLGNSSIVSCETFSVKIQTRVLHAHLWSPLI
jgi:hypothetical protein